MRDLRDEIILSYLSAIGFKGDFATASAALTIIDILDSSTKLCESVAKENPTLKLDKTEFYDGRFWIIFTLDTFSNLTAVPKSTIRRLLKRMDLENIVNQHVFDDRKGIVGYSLHKQLRIYLN